MPILIYSGVQVNDVCQRLNQEECVRRRKMNRRWIEIQLNCTLARRNTCAATQQHEPGAKTHHTPRGATWSISLSCISCLSRPQYPQYCLTALVILSVPHRRRI